MHRHLLPNTYTWIGRSSGISGIGLNYSATKDTSDAEAYIDRGKGRDAENLAIFDQLHAKKDEIERAFGGPLSWERLEGKRACRIRAWVEGGYGAPEEEWPGIQKRLTNAMTRLAGALKPHLKTLQLSGAAEPIIPEEVGAGL